MSKIYFQHELAVVESENIGKDTRIWAFAHILPGAVLELIAIYAIILSSRTM